MEKYLTILLDLYDSSYKSNFKEEFNDFFQSLTTGRKISFIVIIASIIAMVISFLFKKTIIGLVFFAIFICIFLNFMFYLSKNPYPKEKIRNNMEIKLSKFNSLLEAYDCNNDSLSLCIEYLRESIKEEEKKKEQKKNNIFKLFVTFFLSTIIFLGKELWNRMAEYIDDRLLISLIIIVAYFSLIYILISLSGSIEFRKSNVLKKKQGLLKVMEDISLFRKGVKLEAFKEENEIVERVTKMYVEDI